MTTFVTGRYLHVKRTVGTVKKTTITALMLITLPKKAAPSIGYSSLANIGRANKCLPYINHSKAMTATKRRRIGLLTRRLKVEPFSCLSAGLSLLMSADLRVSGNRKRRITMIEEWYRHHPIICHSGAGTGPHRARKIFIIPERILKRGHLRK